VVEGGELLLLGNDFIARYHGSVTPLDAQQVGKLQLQVTVKGVHTSVSVALSRKPPSPAPAAFSLASTLAAISNSPDGLLPLGSVSPEEEGVIHDTGSYLSPSLVELGGSSSRLPAASPDRPTASDRLHESLRTDTYLLYGDQPVRIGPPPASA
jgi:hypothetical protein